MFTEGHQRITKQNKKPNGSQEPLKTSLNNHRKFNNESTRNYWKPQKPNKANKRIPKTKTGNLNKTNTKKHDKHTNQHQTTPQTAGTT